jgi:hypothetical protein
MPTISQICHQGFWVNYYACLTYSLHLASTHNSSPSTATIPSKSEGLERVKLPHRHSLHPAKGCEDGGILFGDTSSAPYLPPPSDVDAEQETEVTRSAARESAATGSYNVLVSKTLVKTKNIFKQLS